MPFQICYSKIEDLIKKQKKCNLNKKYDRCFKIILLFSPYDQKHYVTYITCINYEDYIIYHNCVTMK